MEAPAEKGQNRGNDANDANDAGRARSSPWLSGWVIAPGAVLLTLSVMWGLSTFGHRTDPELAHRLSGLHRVAWLGDEEPSLSETALDLKPATATPTLARALAGEDPLAVSVAMTTDGVDGLLAPLRSSASPSAARSVAAKLQRFEHVHGLRADYLSPRLSLYVPDPLQQLSPELQSALATVARGVLGGARAPKVTSFPEPLRQVRNVEVMVLIRRDGRSLLWRSARGSSIARALLVTTRMARRRWSEREQTLGGPLRELLPELEVEVALLHEDGTLGVRDRVFVDSVFKPEHGVAYERRGGWHYSLPEATQRDGNGAASRAYEKLFADNGLPASTLESPDVRLYRLVVTPLAVSPATESGDNDPARVDSPDDVLGVIAQ